MNVYIIISIFKNIIKGLKGEKKMNKKEKLNIKQITLDELSKIYKNIGYSTNIISIDNKLYLELLNNSKEVIYLVHLHTEEIPLNIDDINNIISSINNSSYACENIVNYMFISTAGYKSESKYIKDENINIYEMQKSNIRLEDSSYLEELVSMFNKETSTEKIELFAHNKIAYESIKESFLSNKKVCVSHATGTGKTILISKCIEDFKDEEVLILSSGNSILDYFSSYSQIADNNVQLMTYYKLSILAEREMEILISSQPKLIVLDEFHRCGAPTWYDSVLKLLSSLPNSYILGTSATPVRYLDDGRDMANEIFDGNVVSCISLYDAIARKILPMPKYVVALYDFNEEINSLNDKINKSRNSFLEKKELKKKVEVLKNRNDSSEYIESVISKYITKERNFIIFCKDLYHMRDMIPIVQGWFRNIFNKTIDINVYELYSGYANPLKELDRYLGTIKGDNDSFNLLFTIDMLNEGVHAKNIDGVILLRPTSSANVYYQQIGRAMSANSSINPLIFDFVNNSDTIQANTFYESIKEAMSNIPKEIEPTNNLNIDYVINHIYDETKDTLNLFKEIEDSLRTSWDYMYEQLVAYYKINGHIIVKEYEDKKLFSWISRCRQSYKLNKLEQDKIDKLNKLNFSWDRFEAKWEEKYQELKEYKDKFGDINNISEKEYSSLSGWLKEQRIAKNNGRLDKAKEEKLNSLGVIWNLIEYAWDSNYKILVDIKNYLGHLNISKVKTYINSNNEEVTIDTKFRKWFSHQKVVLANGEMREDKLEKFKLLEVVTQTNSDRWDTQWKINIQKLIEYKKVYGDTNVPPDYEDKSLRIWVVNIRNKYKESLSQERLKELEEIGFIWSTDDYVWEQSFILFKEELEKHDNNYDFLTKKEYPKLYRWVQNQKRALSLNSLSEYRLNKLNSIGFIWNKNEHDWNQTYAIVEEFVQENGAIIPPAKTYPKIRAWLYKQKRLYANGKLRKDRLEKILSLGYVFE